jgi:hypothetical protein
MAMETQVLTKTFLANLKDLINKDKTWEALRTFLNNFLEEEEALILSKLETKEGTTSLALLIYR